MPGSNIWCGAFDPGQNFLTTDGGNTWDLKHRASNITLRKVSCVRN